MIFHTILTSALLVIHASLYCNYPDHILNRVKTTISCKDCSHIPKVIDAGKVTDNIQTMHNGIKIIKDCYSPWQTEIIKTLNGHHEPQEEKVFFEVLKTIPAKGTMIELGSYWAYYSMWFKSVVPNAHNYMIEPNPAKLEVGKKNFNINNYTGTFINGFIDKYTDLNTTFTDWDEKQYNVPQLCIDDLVEEYKIPFIHILHSDIQGSEYKMLLGAKKTISQNKIGYIFISTHATAENPHQKCLEFLKKNNFHIIASHTIAESFSGDGLIVAQSPAVKETMNVVISKNKKK